MPSTLEKRSGVERRGERNRGRRKKRSNVGRALWLLFLLWLLSLSSVGVIVVNLHKEIETLERANAQLAERLTDVDERLALVADRADVEAIRSDLALLAQSYQELRADAATSASIEPGTPGRQSLAPQASPLERMEAAADVPGEPERPWYSVALGRISYYGSQLVRAVADPLRLRPSVP